MLQAQQFADYPFMVACVHHTTKTHKPEAYTDPRTHEEKERCPLYPSITCDVHENMHCDVLKTNHTPSAIILKPDGSIIFDVAEMDRANSLGATVKKLDEAVARVGRGMARAEYDRVLHELEAIDGDLAAGKYDRAVSALKRVSALKGLTPAMREGRVKAKQDEIEAKGRALVDEAKAKHDSAPDEALKLVKKVISQFKGLEVAKAASELQKAWEQK